MFAVIFKAKIKNLDAEYLATAERMRELAFEKYGCLDFVALSEGKQEVAISYWPDLDSIKRWKSDPEHLSAQALGQANWYDDYSVQITEVLREYKST